MDFEPLHNIEPPPPMTEEEEREMAVKRWIREACEEAERDFHESPGEIVTDLEEHCRSIEIKKEFEANKKEVRKAILQIKDRHGLPLEPCQSTFISTLARRKEYNRERSYIVDKIMPTGRLHMLVGDSGVGKSRWTYEFIKDLSEGKDILGFKSHPVPYLYITCDRSIDSMAETLNTMEMGDWDISAISVMDMEDRFKISKEGDDIWIPDLAALPALFPQVQLFIVEGTGLFQGKGGKSNLNDYYGSVRFWLPIVKAFSATKTTLFCTQHPPKGMVTGERFTGRHMIMGTQSTPGMFDTIMTMHMEKDKRRILTLCNRQMEDLTFEYAMDKGKLVPLTEEIKQKLEMEAVSPQRQELDHFLTTVAVECDFFMPKTVEEWANRDGRKISRMTVRRWLDAMVEGKILRQAGNRGAYSLVKIAKIA